MAQMPKSAGIAGGRKWSTMANAAKTTSQRRNSGAEVNDDIGVVSGERQGQKPANPESEKEWEVRKE